MRYAYLFKGFARPAIKTGVPPLLRNLVDQFIAQPHAHVRELPELLHACVEDGSPEALVHVGRLFEEIPNDALTTPGIAWAFVCWAEAGLDQLVASTLKDSTSKTSRMCLTVLCSVAAGLSDRRGLFWCFERLRPLVQAVNETNPPLSEHARAKLLEFVLAFNDDDELLDQINVAFTFVAFGGPDSAKELFASLAARWLAISKPLLDEYERLIAEHPTEERVFQRFFTAHPQILDPLAAEVWPLPDFHGYRQPDFVLRRFDNTYVVVEIETPAKLLVTGKNTIAATASTAISQVAEYQRFIRRLPNRDVHFPGLDDVHGLAVVGLQASLNAAQTQALRNDNARSNSILTVGFDWLADRARAIQENCIRTGILVRSNQRVV